MERAQTRGDLVRVHHGQFSAPEIADARSQSVTVCVPAKNEQATIGSTVGALMALRRAGVVDQVIVADDSTDHTAEIAMRAGAEVYRQGDLRPEFGPVLGKGDAMWRALSVAQGEIVCFVDADSADFGPRIPCGLIGAVALGDSRFAKGTYRRPFRSSALATAQTGGGRVTELTAKPLLRMLFPPLSEFAQPLAGEIAGTRELFERVPFATFYAVDVVLLIDVWREIGLSSMAEVDLDVRQNRHRSIEELSVMAQQVASGIMCRTSVLSQTSDQSRTAICAPLERPPLEALVAGDSQRLTEPSSFGVASVA
jgi:glucosyl-3-phosphoglycerate synthase